jgi:hypothetical protein
MFATTNREFCGDHATNTKGLGIFGEMQELRAMLVVLPYP